MFFDSFDNFDVRINSLSTGQNQPDVSKLLEQALQQWHYEDAPNSLEQTVPHLTRRIRTTWRAVGRRRYQIHRLTETFLLQQVTKWM